MTFLKCARILHLGVQKLVTGVVPSKQHLSNQYIKGPYYYYEVIMYNIFLEIDKVKRCPFKGTAPETSCCILKGTVFTHSNLNETKCRTGFDFHQLLSGSLKMFFHV